MSTKIHQSESSEITHAEAIAAGAVASKSLLPRLGVSRLVAAGGALMAAGLASLSTIGAHSSYLLHILGPTLVWAAGASILIMPCVVLATRGLDTEHAGLASGLINTARGTSGAIGLAILGHRCRHRDRPLTLDAPG